MKRLILLLLVCSAVVDITQQAYTTDLVDSIEKRTSVTDMLGVIVHSSVMTTIGHWGLFLLGFGILSLAMSTKKANRPTALGRTRP